MLNILSFMNWFNQSNNEIGHQIGFFVCHLNLNGVVVELLGCNHISSYGTFFACIYVVVVVSPSSWQDKMFP